jgi:hypothetical protein
MSGFTRGRFSAPLSLLVLVSVAASCDGSSRNEGQPSAESAGTGGSAGVGGSAGAGASSAGAPAIDIPPSSPRCLAQDAPGAPCGYPACWGTRCAIRFDLTCDGGVWSARDSTLAWDLVCPAGNDSVNSLGDIEMGACCGELLPKNDLHTEPPSCDLCPGDAPDDGDPCSLPDDCAPAVIDCFYKCCCYGNTTWAQCDGTRWRVVTNCSSK